MFVAEHRISAPLHGDYCHISLFSLVYISVSLSLFPTNYNSDECTHTSPVRLSGSQELIRVECITGFSLSGRRACSDGFQSMCTCLSSSLDLNLISLEAELRCCRLEHIYPDCC